MVKPISGPTLAQASALGHEPVVVVKVQWPSGTFWFASRDLVLGSITASGRVSTIGRLASNKKQNNIGMVSSLSLTLTDDDGVIKAAMDASSIEYSVATVYLHFGGLSEADLSQIFSGSIMTPIEWNEWERTLSFQVETRIKDQEVGFSVDYIPPVDPNDIYAPMNPSVPFLDPLAVDKPWPLCFGAVVHVPALRLKTAPKGYLKFPFKGPRDPSQPPTTDPYQDDLRFYLQDGDGAYFPQATLVDVEIDGYIFRGEFGTSPALNGSDPHDIFLVSDPNVPKYENVLFGVRDATDTDVVSEQVAWLATPISIINNWCWFQDSFGNSCWFRVIRQDGTKVEFDKPITVPTTGLPRLLGPGDSIMQVAKHGRVGWLITIGVSVGVPSTVSINNEAQLDFVQQAADILSKVSWKVNAGSEVKLWKPFRADVYVANLIPSKDVICVSADKTNKEGVKELIPIPVTYYTLTNVAPTGPYDPTVVTNVDGPVTVYPTLITIDPPLDAYDGQKWGEQIYVTLHSTQGANTADTIEYLFNTYSVIPTDPTTFADVHAAVDKYPSNFAWFEKSNVVRLCEEIAWQARVGLIIDDGVVKLKYLSKAPIGSVATYTEDDRYLESLKLSFTMTEDIYTRLEAKMKLTYYPARRFERTFIQKNNVAQYGLRKRTVDFFIYNIQSLVIKSLAFWAWREANSWRMVKMDAPLESVLVEVFDNVDLAFVDTSILNASSIIGELSAYSLDLKQERNSLEIWLPYLAGTIVQSPKAYIDDTGDVAPADPTTKYNATPADIRLSDDESKFRAITRITSENAATLGIVTAVTPNLGDPSLTDVTVDEYGNGYDQPPTASNTTTRPVDPSNPAPIGAHITVSNIGGVDYSTAPAMGGATFKIKVYPITHNQVFNIPVADITLGTPFMAIASRPWTYPDAPRMVLPPVATLPDGQIICVKDNMPVDYFTHMVREANTMRVGVDGGDYIAGVRLDGTWNSTGFAGRFPYQINNLDYPSVTDATVLMLVGPSAQVFVWDKTSNVWWTIAEYKGPMN